MLVVYCCRNLWPGFYVVLSEIVSCTEAVWVLNVTEHDPTGGSGCRQLNATSCNLRQKKSVRGNVDLWDIEVCHWVRIGEYHLKNDHKHRGITMDK